MFGENLFVYLIVFAKSAIASLFREVGTKLEPDILHFQSLSSAIDHALKNREHSVGINNDIKEDDLLFHITLDIGTNCPTIVADIAPTRPLKPI